MRTIIAISGSLRRRSYNTALLEAMTRLAPPGIDVSTWPLDELPVYNADVEREHGFPPPVAELREALAAADGLIVATPEYNFSISGVLKNAIDWLSQAPASPLDEKPTAILGGGGRSGTRHAQRHLREILGHNRVDVLDEPEVLVPRAWEAFDEELNLQDPAVEADLRKLVEALASRIAEGR